MNYAMDDYFSILRSREIWINDQLNIKEVVNEAKIIQYQEILAGKWKKTGLSVPCVTKFGDGSRRNARGDATALACIQMLSSIVSKQQKITEDGRYFSRDMAEDITNIHQTIICIVRKLLNSNKPEIKPFLRLYFSLENIPLEILYIFQETGLSEVSSYIIKNICHSQNISQFVKSLSTIICYGGDNEIHEKVSVSILSTLVAAVYGSVPGSMLQELLTANEQQLNTVLTSILDKVHENLLTLLPEDNITEPEVDREHALTPVDIYGLLCKTTLLGGQKSQIICSFFSNQLADAIKFAPDVTMNQAFLKQHEWCCSKSPQHLCQLLQSLLIPFDAKNALDLIKKVMLKGNFNWRIMLTLMSVYISTKEGSGAIMKEYLSSVVLEGFAKSCPETLKLGLLLARQCGSEGDSFPSYAEWFSFMFGSRGGTKKNEGSAEAILNSMNNFKLLMAVITDLVPVESISGLKAHMSCPPQASVSANTRSIISDYLHLARTRLSDFGVLQADQGGLFQSKQFGKQEASTSGSSGVEAEIETVLSHFEKTGNILQAVLNASLFQKRYFEQTFLPTLLKPRLLPEKPDSKMKLIELLTSKGLISAAMLENYQKTCEKEFGKT